MDDDVNVTFLCPTITPKVYLAKGPSGWPEPFKRADADAALLKFITPVAVKDLVDVFIGNRATGEKKEIDWYTVVGFLARTMGCTPKTVPHSCGVAFWAHVLIARDDQAN